MRVYGLQNENQEANLYIYDDVVSGSGIPEAIRKLNVAAINVHISSYGGDVCEGIAIYTALKDSKAKVTTYCDGMACSIASVIFMAGEQRRISKLGYVMIHNAWNYAAGDAKEMQKNADMLNKVNQAAVKAYMDATGQDEDNIKQMMDAETWMDSDEAVSLGFATDVIDTEEDENPSQSARKAVYRMIRQALESEEDNNADALDEAIVGAFKVTKQGNGLLIVPEDETGAQSTEPPGTGEEDKKTKEDEEAEQRLSAFFNAFLN